MERVAKISCQIFGQLLNFQNSKEDKRKRDFFRNNYGVIFNHVNIAIFCIIFRGRRIGQINRVIQLTPACVIHEPAHDVFKHSIHILKYIYKCMKCVEEMTGPTHSMYTLQWQQNKSGPTHSMCTLQWQQNKSGLTHSMNNE